MVTIWAARCIKIGALISAELVEDDHAPHLPGAARKNGKQTTVMATRAPIAKATPSPAEPRDTTTAATPTTINGTTPQILTAVANPTDCTRLWLGRKATLASMR